jgi:hypothetical protein
MKGLEVLHKMKMKSSTVKEMDVKSRLQRVYRRTGMYRDGYVVLQNLVTILPAVRLKAAKRLRQAGAIFNDTVAYPRNDRRRRQSDINIVDADVPGFERLASILGLPNDLLKSWVVLHSLPGCKAQGAHADYELNAQTWRHGHSRVSHGCLLALYDDTTLDVWKGAHIGIKDDCGPPVVPIERSTVKLRAGDALVFRADCLHAGSAYDKENVRLHCYLDLNDMPHTMNRVMRWTKFLPSGALSDA